MRSFATMLLLLSILAGFVLILGDPPEARANEANGTLLTQDKVAEQLEALTKRVAQLEKDKTSLDLKNKTQTALLRDIYGWMRSVDQACDSLNTSLDTARKNGFEKAGPNPRAKKAVINGLKAFVKTVSSGNPTAPKKTGAK